MSSKPETILLNGMGDMARCIPVDIPVTSPYYDRLMALKQRMNFVSAGSSEHSYLCQQIEEMESRARRRIEADTIANYFIH